MMFKGKYDGLKTDSLIRYVQDEIRKYKDPKIKKKARTKATIKKMEELRNIQYELGNRLKNMNRLDPKFFPVNCWVSFTKSEAFKVYSDEGLVVGHDEGTGNVLVKLNNDPEVGGVKRAVAIQPRYLKLLHLREYYL